MKNNLAKLRDRYLPLKLIGSGGFSKVYLAQDCDRLNEKCVIKQFFPYQQNNAELSRLKELFLQEAYQLIQLGQHPQIPALQASFEEKGELYLVLEYIEGETLEQELKRGGYFTEDEIIDFLFELLTVLQFIHNKKIIHRDIKPSNIIRRIQTNSKNSLVLIDLGIAKNVKKNDLTNGTQIGSFGYVSKEQMTEGKSFPSSDLYGLGVTCFHLLTEVDPCDLWNEKAYQWTLTWRESLRQKLNPVLVEIIDGLLQIDYRNRYQSASEVLFDLAPLINPVKHKVNPSSIAINTQIKPKKTELSSLNQLAPTRVIINNSNIGLRFFKNNLEKLKIIAASIIIAGLFGTIATQKISFNLLCKKFYYCSNNRDFVRSNKPKASKPIIINSPILHITKTPKSIPTGTLKPLDYINNLTRQIKPEIIISRIHAILTKYSTLKLPISKQVKKRKHF
jgi:serine/threonine protein kinase